MLFELIYSNAYGPIKVKFIGGASYLIIFINDCFRKVCAYAIRTND